MTAFCITLKLSAVMQGKMFGFVHLYSGQEVCASVQQQQNESWKCYLFEHPSLFASACIACALDTCRLTSAIIFLLPFKDCSFQNLSIWQAVPECAAEKPFL